MVIFVHSRPVVDMRGHVERNLGSVMVKVEGQGESWHGHVTSVTVAPKLPRRQLTKKLTNLLEDIRDNICVFVGSGLSSADSTSGCCRYVGNTDTAMNDFIPLLSNSFITNMSYEELLALKECIRDVNTGLTETPTNTNEKGCSRQLLSTKIATVK
ncbi:hypothetical protein QVD17_16689 [Tagetes erecta]|uniref:Uncharacterized protein n=1 Tax=Tagetes erecta TaxID=13708 RepID=A0AAD8KX53_TARER|nr:hypothetical protein QVD17_16689 [Tagetes erecta]